MFKFDPTPHNDRFLIGARKGKMQHNPIWTVEKHFMGLASASSMLVTGSIFPLCCPRMSWVLFEGNFCTEDIHKSKGQSREFGLSVFELGHSETDWPPTSLGDFPNFIL
jgi:hypothetical protein